MRGAGELTLADRATGRDNNFNLIRMLAALGVLVSHAYPLALGPGTPEPFETVLKGDNLGRASVFVFFAISGFFITRSFAGRRGLGAFLRARALRLFPALLVMLLVTVASGWAWLSVRPADLATEAPAYVLQQLLLEFPYRLGLMEAGRGLPGMFETTPGKSGAINGSLWTLPFEVLCYLGVMAVGLAGLLARPRLFALLLVVCTAGYLYRLDVLAQGQGVPWTLGYLTYLGFPFAIGMAFWVWRDRVVLSWPLAAGLVGLAALCWSTILFTPLFVLALSYAVFVVGYMPSPLLQRYNRLGDYSYGTYLYAFPIQQMVTEMGADTPLTNMLAALPLVLICAVLSWHLVEGPALRFKGRMKAARPKAFGFKRRGA